MTTFFPIAIDIFSGFSLGQGAAGTKVSEDSVRRGKNYYLAAAFQGLQAVNLGALVYKVAETAAKGPLSKRTSVLCNVVPLLSFPVLFSLAALRQGDYPKIRNSWNRYTPKCLHLPEKLGKRTVSVIDIVTDKIGNLFRVATLVGTLALLRLGKYVFATAALVPLSYELMAHMGLVSLKIRNFVETYVPLVEYVGGLVDGTLSSRMTTLFLGDYGFSVPIAFAFQRTIDAILSRCLFSRGPSIAVTDQPLKERKDLSYEQILQILDAESDDQYVIEPTHLSKDSFAGKNLPRSYDFDQLEVLFNHFDWEGENLSNLLIRKLMADDRFRDEVLAAEFPALKDEFKTERTSSEETEFYKKVLQCFSDVAQKKGMTKENFAVQWTKEQLKGLIKTLKGDQYVEGDQHDIGISIDKASLLVPLLLRLEDGLLLQDALLKLAIEGGNYCPPGIRRACTEVLDTQLQNGNLDPKFAFELKLRQAFIDTRTRIVQGLYLSFASSSAWKWLPDSIKTDVHIQNGVTRLFSLGFAPLADHERAEISLMEFMAIRIVVLSSRLLNKLFDRFEKIKFFKKLKEKDSYKGAREFFMKFEIFDTYKKEVLNDRNIAFLNPDFYLFLRTSLEENPKLTADQRDEIIERFGDFLEEEADQRKKIHAFNRLAFVQLGILTGKI